MPPHKHRICYRICEICGKRTNQVSNTKRTFMAKFPLDEERCRLWVKFVGKEDLIYVPIEKLHTLKHVCGDHFTDRDFNKKKNRLKRSAFPSIYLKADPLPDEMLLEFPYHIHPSHYSQNMCNNEVSHPQLETLAGSNNSDPLQPIRKKLMLHQDHTYSKDTDNPELAPEVSGPTITEYCYKKPKPNSGRLFQPSIYNLEDHTNAAAVDHLEDDTDLADETEPVQFSWQNTDQISIDEDGDSIFDDGPSTMDMVVDSKSTGDGEGDADPKKNNENHTEYFCDSCSKEIIGFRYTCVQCENYDLCCACEGNMRHALHYMLRVPGQKPFSEVNSILEAVREKIKLLTEEAQKDSTGLDLDEIKLEEPEFEEVTVDPFSDVTTPADHHTSEHHIDTSDSTDTTHTNDTGASDTHTIPHSEQSKAVITIPSDVLLKRLNIKSLVENTSVPHTEPHSKSTILNMLDCHVELTRLPKTYTQKYKDRTTVSHDNDKPVTEVVDLERRYFTHKRKQELNSATYGDAGSDRNIHRNMPEISNPLRCVIPGCESTSATQKLYRFPWNRRVLSVWRTILEGKFPGIKLTLDTEGRCHKFVCLRHFERKYLLKDGRRDRFAIPTLFTEVEVATKRPEQRITFEQVEREIISKQKALDVDPASEGTEYLGVIWLEDETEPPGYQDPISHAEETQETTTETPFQEYLEEMWLDETLLELKSQQETFSEN